MDTNKLVGIPYIEPAPDLTVRLRDGGFVSILKSSDIVIPRKHPDGTHRPNGIFIGYGPDIKAGEKIDPIDLLDMTPLMLYFLGLPVPSNLEGRVPAEALRKETLEAREVEQGGATVTTSGGDSDKGEPSEEEREALLKQMKLLGYMD